LPKKSEADEDNRGNQRHAKVRPPFLPRVNRGFQTTFYGAIRPICLAVAGYTCMLPVVSDKDTKIMPKNKKERSCNGNGGNAKGDTTRLRVNSSYVKCTSSRMAF
jgi:hypothetical protein